MFLEENEQAWKNDKMERQGIANIITEQINQYFTKAKNDGFVVGVYGGYGTGKTFFLENYVRELEDNEELNYKVGHINIKEIELASHPITAILRTLKQLLKGDEIFKETFNKFTKMFKNSKFTLSSGLSHGINARWQMDLKDLFEDENQQQHDLNKFKDILKEMLGKNKIVIFIDELDRCNPKFVVSFIDIITHFFGLKNLVFLLGVNHSYVEKSIAHVYGQDIATDGEGYLTKFINFSIDLPIVLHALIDIYITKYNINDFKDLFKNDSLSVDNNLKLQAYIQKLVGTFNISARLLEKIFMRLRLFLQNYNKLPSKIKNPYIFNHNQDNYEFFIIKVIVFLSVVHETKANLFMELHDTNTWQEIIPSIFSSANSKVITINNYMFPEFFYGYNKNTEYYFNYIQGILDTLHDKLKHCIPLNYPYYQESNEKYTYNNNILQIIQALADICIGKLTHYEKR